MRCHAAAGGQDSLRRVHAADVIGAGLLAAKHDALAAWFAQLDPERLSVSFDDTPVFTRGAPTGTTPALGGAVCRIALDLGLGEGSASYLAADLSYDYVRINAEYTT